jgi:hypothetical protein
MAAVVAPLPPRRPAEAMIVAAAAIAMPLPPPRPVQLAALDGGMANLAVPAMPLRGAGPPAPPMPPAPPAPRATLVRPDADSKAQLKALFEAVEMGPVKRAASGDIPVRMATTRALATVPEDSVAAAPGSVTTRFARDVPDGAPSGARFTGSAARMRLSQ